jgi:hypothetical protein
MFRLLRWSELKSLGLSFSSAGDDCFQMSDARFKSLIESLQKSTRQKPDGVCRSKIEWALPDSVDRFFQEVAHITDTLQRCVRGMAFVKLRTAILLSSLST